MTDSFLYRFFAGSILAISILTSSYIFLGQQTFAKEPNQPDEIDESLTEGKISAAESNASTANKAKSNTPYDVEYHETGRSADLNKFGDFSPVTSIGSLGQKILKLMFGILGGIGLLGIILGGFIIMSSSGDESLLDRGKNILLYSVIGIAISLLALGITTLVQTIFYSVGS